MRRVVLVAVAAAAGALLALAALGVLHHRLLPGPALAAGLLVGGSLVALRAPWAHLPSWIGLWLDLGVVVSVALVAAVGHGLTTGLAFAVLRGPELGLLFAAALAVAVGTTGLAYTHLRLADEVAAQQGRVAELERTALQSRLAVLSAQVNPHFLFNTLNTLAEVVHEDADAAEELVLDLAATMRTALRSSTGLVPLAEELALVRRLLRIESARLGDRLQWSIDGEAALVGLSVRVPGLLIQPLVENAIAHGVAPRAGGGRVAVAVAVRPGAARVTVADDGPGLPADVAAELAAGTLSLRGLEGHGGGLRSCLERLRLTWPDGAATLALDPEAAGTCLILDLPLDGELR